MARKHYTQFEGDELAFVTGFVRGRILPRTWSATDHFYDRAADRNFTFADARAALRFGRVIEIHNDRGEWRVLVRSHLGTCVVLSLENFKIVTVYDNDPEDNHDTLNRSAYRNGESVDVVAVIKNLQRRTK